MTINLTYRYSELDKQHEFGLEAISDNKGYSEVLYNWVWFELGRLIGDKNIYLLPFSISNLAGTKTLATYKKCVNADKLAKLIANHINKKLSK